MRFVHLRIPAFGQLRELDTGPDELPALVVVQGRNESGKSTFFSAIRSLLFGIYPTERDRHPYTPWSGDNAHLEGDLALADGSRLSVRRRLLSSPRGTLIRGEVEENIRNTDLPLARHVRKEVYSQLFALTLAEMASLEGDDWAQVQDRLFGGMGVRDIRTGREVADELEQEAGPLWRITRHGNQQVRMLDDRIRELAGERREALERDILVRQHHDELARARARREELRSERHVLAARLERLETLAPIRRQVAEVERLEAELGGVDGLEGLPPDPGGRMSELEDRIRDLAGDAAEIQGEIETLEARTASVTPADRALHDQARELRSALAEQAGLAELRREELRLEASLSAHRDELTAEVRDVLDRSLDEDLPSALRDFPLSEFGETLRQLEDARSALNALPAEPEAPTPGSAPLPVWLPVAALAAAVMAAGAGLAAGMPSVAVGAVILAAVGFILLARSLQAQRDARARAEDHEKRVREWSARRDDRRAALERAESDALSSLAVLDPGEHAAGLRLDLVGRIEGLRARAREVAGEEERMRVVRERVGQAETALDPFRRFLDPGDGAGTPEARAHLLEQALEDASDRMASAESASQSLDPVRKRARRLTEELTARRDEREQLEERLAHLGDGDVQAGCRRLAERRRREGHLEEMRSGLRQRVPDLAARVDEIRAAEEDGVDWSADAGTLGQLRAEDERLNEEDKELVGRISELETTLEQLGQRTTVDQLDGEVERLDQERERLARRRDRLWTLARVVREAERRVRERHQPTVLRTAAGYLATLTRGRYDEFVRMGDDGRSFGVRGPGLTEIGGHAPSHELGTPLSTGTREQIYMALRLAIVDELDGGADRLPLLLDEVMVNWDDERRARGLDLLQEVASERQCFFFTCHPEMAEAMETRGARRIVLPDPVGG